MATTYTVKKGDTLWALAIKYKTTVNNLVKLNDIADPDYIVVGQVLKISGTATSVAKNTSTKAKITVFGRQANAERTLYAVWSFDRANTKEYQVEWEYSTGQGTWFSGSTSTVTNKQSLYTAPANAVSVRFRVKPVATTKKDSKGNEVPRWTGYWSDRKSYSFANDPPGTPNKPSISITGTKLTVNMTDLGGLNATHIEFNVAKNDSPSYQIKKIKISATDSVTFETNVAVGAKYKVKCRGVRKDVYGNWSAWSNEDSTIPAAPKDITECKISEDKTTITVIWSPVIAATKYAVEYSPNRTDFTSDTPENIKTVNDITDTTCVITDFNKDETEYFFRVKAINTKGDSAWSAIKSTLVNTKAPAAPYIWTDSRTITTGDPLTLYWQHQGENEKDVPNYSDLEVYIDGAKTIMPTIDHSKEENTNESDKQKKAYTLDTSVYSDGARVQWRVRTARSNGVFGEWSELYLVYIYDKPEMTLTFSDKHGNSHNSEAGEDVGFILESLPFDILADVSANFTVQKPISYYVSVKANEAYETVDNVGNPDVVNEGEIVYSQHFDTVDTENPNVHFQTLSAGDLSLVSDISYTITCLAVMDSGLSVETSLNFLTSWTESEYFINAEIAINEEDITASIQPYCRDNNNALVEDILLYVYRREYDGKFTELASDVDNLSNTYIVDPHPALDYARYRIVAQSKTTGAVYYTDIPGRLVGCKSIILQWDEQWTNFDVTDDGAEEPSWTGSLLKLPYNIDITDKYTPDVSLIKYIGRDSPVSYYGTHRGETSTWNVVIEKNDKETLYALRRLAKWMGNVYVREPSGSGYWANVKVTWSQKHLDLTIPVQIEVTRVEGGV